MLCVDPLHFLAELRHGEGLLCCAAAHKTAGAMRSGEVPVLISLASTQQAAIPHVDRDQEPLTALRGHRALAKHHVLRVDIVMDRCELLKHMESHAFYNHVHHRHTIEHRILLGDPHVVDILIEQNALYIGNRVELLLVSLPRF